MLPLEKTLESIGFVKFQLDTKDWKYKPSFGAISTMGELDVRFFRKSDPILQKISKSVPITEMTTEDRSGEIVIGINERGKPPTLIYPRPKMRVKRVVSGEVICTDERYDDNMNAALRLFSESEIISFMLDQEKTIELDLT